jgi:hypothetical protein
MFPVGAVAGLLLWLINKLYRERHGVAAGGVLSRDFVVRGGLALLILGASFSLFMAALQWLASGDLAAAPWVVGFGVLAFPGPLSRRLLVPLGLPRLAFALASIPTLGWARDREGGAILTAVWAVNRCRRPSERHAAWIESRLARCRQLGGAGMVASAIAAAWRGELETAWCLLWAVELGHAQALPAMARRHAAAWLAASAAERGDWAAVVAIGERRRFVTRFTRFLALVGRSLLAAYSQGSPPRAATLVAAWLLAPHRRATRQLLRRALHASGANATDGASRGKGASRARRRTSPGAVARADAGASVIALARTWEAVIADPQLAPALLHRAAVLGAAPGTVEAAIAELRREVFVDLAEQALAARIRLARLRRAGLADLAAAVREELMTRLEAAVEATARRVEAARALPPVDELREWVALRSHYDRAAESGGPALRRLAFSAVHRKIGSLGVWLFNVRRERPLAHAILRWLQHEAQRVGDEDVAELQRRNVALGI